MTTSSIRSYEGSLQPSAERKEILRNELIRVREYAKNIRMEIGQINRTLVYANSDLFKARELTFQFTSRYKVAWHLMRMSYDSARYNTGGALPPTPYPELVTFDWTPSEPTADELEELSYVSQIEEIREESEHADSSQDSDYKRVRSLELDERGFANCIRSTSEKIISLESEKKTNIEKLARIRFEAKDIRKKVLIYTPEKERLVELERQYSQTHLPPPSPSPKVESSPQKTKPHWTDAIWKLINRICAFIKKCFQFLFCRSAKANPMQSSEARSNASPANQLHEKNIK